MKSMQVEILSFVSIGMSSNILVQEYTVSVHEKNNSASFSKTDPQIEKIII